MPADALIGTRMMLAHPAIFGKLPGHGDFISRGIPGDLRDAIDLWLSDWLGAARAACAEAFEADYEAAAPWLFEGWETTAVLIPSMDSVGRRFPLLVVTASDWVTQDIYDAMIAALVEGASADDLRTALAAPGARDASARDPRARDAGSRRTARWFLPEGAEQLLPMPDSVASWPSVEGCFV